MTDEAWKPVPDLPGIEASSWGRVRRTNGRQIACCSGPQGYRRCGVGVRKFLVHRLVAKAFLGLPAGDLEVNHKDGNPANNHVSNLEWVTRSENHRHAYRVLGRKSNLTHPRGEDHHAAKLNRHQIGVIRRARSFGCTQQFLADIFGVSQSLVSYISRGQRWGKAA